jgi:hypothetical protein
MCFCTTERYTMDPGNHTTIIANSYETRNQPRPNSHGIAEHQGLHLAELVVKADRFFIINKTANEVG